MSYWWVDGNMKLGLDSSIAFVRKNGDKIPYFGADLMGGPREDVHAAASEAKPRVELMDEMGIHTQIVYPNVMGFAAPAMVQQLDRELAYTIIAIYNDAIAEWQEEGQGRLAAGGAAVLGHRALGQRSPAHQGPRADRGDHGR